MVTILSLIIVGVAAYSLTQNLNGLTYIIFASSVMSVAIGLLLLLMRGYGKRLAQFLPKRIQNTYNRFHQGTIGSLRQIPTVFALGLTGWLLEVGRLFLVVQALGSDVGFPLILITALGHAILSTVPTPGGIGAVEPGITSLLMIDLTREGAASIAIVDRSVTYLSVLLLGGLAFLVLQASQSRRRKSQVEALVT